jgi:hypothetical protein
MNAFVDAIQEQESRTSNGMKARKTSANALVDFFYSVGASRGKDVIPAFTAAYVQDPELTLRIVLWSRDVREGAGERQIFRDILTHLENTDPDAAARLMNRVPELGRFDDLLVFKTKGMKTRAFTLLGEHISAKNALAAKWTPRKGPIASEFRQFLGLSPKQYRKTLVELTSVVETQMCKNDWDNINFSHVPSQASRIYKKAFNRHTSKFAEYVAKLVKGDPDVKVNAGAIFPHDVLKGVIGTYGTTYFNKTELDHVVAQWDALPNYVGDANIMPLVDVSGSMGCPAGKSTSVTCLAVSVSLGLYLADKNRGAFNGTFLTFSDRPELLTLKGNVVQKAQQMIKSSWGMSTNLHAAFDKILSTAVKNNVPQGDMPKILLILSDMQFNQSVNGTDDSAMEMIERKYSNAGYILPQVVFWNLNSYDNVPVKSDKSGAALVSGFSPSILKGILSADLNEFTPEGVMMKTIMSERYDC